MDRIGVNRSSVVDTRQTRMEEINQGRVMR
jgi:hypothetical protein